MTASVAERTAEPAAALADPDVDVVPEERCGCPRHRRTVHRCRACGRPVCFHCQTPSIGGKCAFCLPPMQADAPKPRLAWRAAHGSIAVAAALAAAALAATTLMRFLGYTPGAM